MDSRFYRHFPYNLLLIALACYFFVNCSIEKVSEEQIIVVKVPPFYNDKLSREENFYRFQHFLFPQIEIPNPILHGIPNDDSLLYVLLKRNGELQINSQPIGTISDTRYLEKLLKEAFREREKNHVYEPNSQKIVKAVGIEAARSVKYGDFYKLVEALKQSGADPLVLLFDDDARPKFIINTEDN